MKRICIYAHYDSRGTIKGYVRHCLSNIRNEFDELVFVTSSTLGPFEKSKIAGLCTAILEVENIGFDFYSWKKGIETVRERLNTFDALVLLNSSVLGPVSPLGNVFAKMEASRCDFWGMTECFLVRHHLQSYFLCCNGRMCSSRAFREYWSALEPLAVKEKVISEYETAFTRHFARRGFKKGVAFPVGMFIPLWKRILDKNLAKRNTTLVFAPELLEAGMPFVKIQLLASNPFGADLPRLRALLEQRYPAEYLAEACTK